jgi:glutamine cyclotransferase
LVFATTTTKPPHAKIFPLIATIVACGFFSCASHSPMPNSKTSRAYRVVRELPHDVTRFTEGLEFDDGVMLESTGRNGQSALIQTDLRSGAVLRTRALPSAEFGEGVTSFGDRVFQLTWRDGVVHVYDPQLSEVATLHYEGEGWGMTHDATMLIVSDGTPRLQFRDPRTFAVTRTLDVSDHGEPLERINELEYVDGRIYANVWLTDRIAVIDAKSGAVESWIDLSALKSRFAKPADFSDSDDVLNGIAFDRASGHFYVTGKRWPKMFEIALEP